MDFPQNSHVFNGFLTDPEVLFLHVPREVGPNQLFILGVLGLIDPREKFDRERSPEVRKMLGCLKCKCADCIFTRQRLYCILRLKFKNPQIFAVVLHSESLCQIRAQTSDISQPFGITSWDPSDARNFC